MARRGLWLGLIWFFVGVSAAVAACDGDANSGGSQQPQSDLPIECETNDDSPECRSEQSGSDRVVVLSTSDVGSHLEEQFFGADLRSWLESSEDPTIAELPGRVPESASSGIAFAPSQESPTDETFWLHVFNDQSTESAVGWVEYLASQSPQLAGLVVPHHGLFGASFLVPPEVGDASLAIELLHGHRPADGIGCWHSVLVVFAQERVVVFLFNSIEITRDDDGSGASANEAGVPQHCNVATTMNRLTDLDAIAQLTSERLSEYQSDSSGTAR